VNGELLVNNETYVSLFSTIHCRDTFSHQKTRYLTGKQFFHNINFPEGAFAMINHISIGVRNPEKVANIVAELWGGYALPFPPSPGGYVAFADDGIGTMVEIIPSNIQLLPGTGLPDEATFSRETITDDNEGAFTVGDENPQFGSVHLNINSPLGEAEIKAIAAREGWRCFIANRGRGLFQLIEFWVEDRFLIEVNTPEMTKVYREIVNPENWAKFLQAPLPPKYAGNVSQLVS
jgi:hypothetical protein